MTDVVREDLRLLHIKVYIGRITAVTWILIGVMVGVYVNVFDVDIVEFLVVSMFSLVVFLFFSFIVALCGYWMKMKVTAYYAIIVFGLVSLALMSVIFSLVSLQHMGRYDHEEIEKLSYKEMINLLYHDLVQQITVV